MRIRLKREMLAKHLAKRQISQNRWAQILGISRGHLSDLLSGRHVYPSAATRRKILGQLDADFEDLFEIELETQAKPQGGNPRRNPGRGRGGDSGGRTMAPFFPALIQDLTYAGRLFMRNRGLSLAAILTLGLGIGATTALFSVAHAVLLEKLPVKSPDQLVMLACLSDPEIDIGLTSGWSLETPEGLRSSTSLPYPSFVHMSEGRNKLDSLFAFAPASRLTLQWRGKSELGQGQLVSGNYFQALGLSPALGRLIGPGDDSPNAAPAAVLSHQYWRSRFSSDPAVAGQPLRINQTVFTIAGVAPPGFNGTLQLGSNPEVFIPLTYMESLHGFKEASRDPDRWWLLVMGRLKPEAGRKEALSALNVLFQQSVRDVIEEKNADKNLSELYFPAIEFKDGSQGQYEMRHRLADTIEVAAILVGLVLLLAGVNAAALLIAKAARRRREMAVRLSLGASRWRLVRQLATESILLALMAAGAGLLIAWWGKELMAGLVAARNSLGATLAVSLNVPVLLFALGVSLLTGVVFGILPAFKASRVDPAPALKEDSGRATLSRSTRMLGRALVLVQVALAVVVLVAAGLLLTTLSNLMSVDPGFNPDNLLAFRVDPASSPYGDRERLELYERLRQRLEALGAVRSVSYSGLRPVGGSVNSLPFSINGEKAFTYFNYAGPFFLETMQMPIISGRDFDRRDGRSMPTAVVSETLARKFFPNQSPLGHVIEAALSEDGAKYFRGFDQKFEIVGVAGDSKYAELREDPVPTIFLPARQNPHFMRSAYFHVRLAAAPDRVIPEIEKAVRSLDRNLPITNLQMYPARIQDSIDQERQFALVTSFFGLLALLLVAVGLYGTLSHSVTSRTREFGVRQALGANRGNIMRLVMREIVVVLIGLAIGIAASLGVAKTLSSLVFGLGTQDPATMAAACLILLSVALLAAYLPARRAARVDPVTALRAE